MITEIDKNTALVLIDLQKGILKMETAHPTENILKNVASLVDTFRKKGLPIVVVNVIPMGAERKNIRVEMPLSSKNAALQEGFADIIPEIKTTDGDIFITKRTWNAFCNTSLHQELQKRNVTGIVLGGISTSIGVEGTARAASELGYNISFATDAMTDRLLAAHENSIRNIFPRIGELGSTKEIIKILV
jgi:nicotinamidase-related amidase